MDPAEDTLHEGARAISPSHKRKLTATPTPGEARWWPRGLPARRAPLACRWGPEPEIRLLRRRGEKTGLPSRLGRKPLFF